MKKNILLITAVLITSISFAQEIFISDSVIYFDKKPVALYAKELSKTPLRYNIEILNLNYQSLIKAEVMKFDAPVAELKPFFYYELTFPTVKDTLAIYLEDEAFLLVLSKIIRDYKLIRNNTVNELAYRRFKMSYPGGPAFMAQIKSVVDYLDDTRYFRQQTVRDRTKPVSIINDRVIMQDGKKIGIIFPGSTTVVGPNVIADYTSQVPEDYQVQLVNGRVVDLKKLIGGASYYFYDKESYGSGNNLYNRSFPVNNIYGPNGERKLRAICYLIENYAL
ncbi:MAG: hypothetical protein ABI666_04315 [Ferruginibacter sp.]